MILKVKPMGFDAGGKHIVILNKDDAADIGVRSSGRVWLRFGKKQLIAIVNVAKSFIKRGEIGVYTEVAESLKIKGMDDLEVDIARPPVSLEHLKNKLKGRKLEYEEIFEIVRDVVQGRLSDSEIGAFVTALHERGMHLGEAFSLTQAMVKTGESLRLNKKIICDKHSIGSALGDKSTLLVVPIIAAAGFTIPKTSSRAITSAAGSADKAEVLMPVNLNMDEMKKVVERTNGCIVWGGSLHLAPADDIFIHVEYPLSIDPMLLPSIMSKKKAVGATHLVIDIPTGRGAKIKTVDEADFLARDFIELGNRLKINTQCLLTYGDQPIGYTMGPALEAREALQCLMRLKYVPDVLDKACHLAGTLLEMIGKTNGYAMSMEIIRSGAAEKKFREIIEMQGGDRNVKPEDIKIGAYGFDVTADANGVMLWVDNKDFVDIARAAGSPYDKGAGIELHKKIGDNVKKGERIITVHADKTVKLERARKILEKEDVFAISEKKEMVINRIRGRYAPQKMFVLER